MVTQEELEKMSPEEIAELQRKNCIFCKIISGEVPGQTVFSDETTHAILDIHPARDGHVLVLPKEHVPILPLLPPDQFEKLFANVKKISRAIKEGMHTNKVSVFVANGPAAGQQASHFMLHVIARDEGDALASHFSLPPSKEYEKTQQEMIPALKQNLPLMLKNHFKRLGKTPFEKTQQGNAPKQPLPSTTPADAFSQNASEERLQPSEQQQEQIAKFFEMYPQARSLLEQDAQQFEQLLEKVQPEVKDLFAGIDLQTLSSQLSKLAPTISDAKTSAQKDPEATDSGHNFSAADVFQGEDPEAQIRNIMQYFKQKPKAKELFLSDLKSFESLLETREDIQPLFKDVDLEKLALVLDQLLAQVGSGEQN